MNKLHFVLFTLVALCLFSSVLSQSTSGGSYLRIEAATSGSWRNHLGALRVAADDGVQVENITVEAVYTIAETETGLPVNFTIEYFNKTFNQIQQYFSAPTTAPFPPNTTTITPNFETNATEIKVELVYYNDAPNNTNHNRFITVTNTTNTTAQGEYFNNTLFASFNGTIRTVFETSNITANISSVDTILGIIPPPTPNTSSTSTGTTSPGTSTTTSSANSLSLSLLLFTFACLLLAFLI